MIRNSIGFDRLFDALEHASRSPAASSNAPGYDVVRIGDNAYRIAVAVPGHSKGDIQVIYEPNLLMISGSREPRKEGIFLHRGIPDAPFEFRFDLADHVEVTAANLADGMLTIDLKREVPEAMKPRRISISPAQGVDDGGHPKAA
jgi:molecular chaperone IbpA